MHVSEHWDTHQLLYASRAVPIHQASQVAHHVLLYAKFSTSCDSCHVINCYILQYLWESCCKCFQTYKHDYRTCLFEANYIIIMVCMCYTQALNLTRTYTTSSCIRFFFCFSDKWFMSCFLSYSLSIFTTNNKSKYLEKQIYMYSNN